jgi:hypothetical protein
MLILNILLDSEVNQKPPNYEGQCDILFRRL